MKLQKRYILIVGVVLAVLLALAAGLLFWGRRPFRDLKAADIASASVTLRPPDVTLELNGAEIEALAELLGDLRITWEGGGSVCFGALSLLPKDNFRGMRKDVIEKLKELGIKVLRWPGGNFAGEFNWMDGLLPVEWNGRILCRVTESGAVRYDPTWVDTDRAKAALAQVAEAAGTVMEYMTLLEAAPPLKAEGLADGYRVLAEFNGTVLAGTETLLGAQFVTWPGTMERSSIMNMSIT